MRLVHYWQPEGPDPDPLQIPPNFPEASVLSFLSIIFSPLHILDEVRESSVSSSCCMGQKWARIRCPGLLSRERESGLGILSGLELIHSHETNSYSMMAVV